MADPYFTTVEFRAVMPDMDNEAKYPDVRVELARDAVEQLIERACGTSFVARTVTEVVSPTTSDGIVLGSPYIQSVTSVTSDGVLLSGYTYTTTGGLLKRVASGAYSPTAWNSGNDNTTVVYESGYSAECPADLKLAAMMATRDRVLRLTSQGASDRATSISNELGGTTSYSVASEDHPTGLPDADAVIMGWAAKVNVFGFA